MSETVVGTVRSKVATSCLPTIISVILTDTTPGSSAEGNVAVVVPVRGVLWQEVIRVEGLRVLVVFRVAVDLEGANHNSGASRQDIVVGC